MHHISCDRCGKGLLLEESVRYEVRIDVRAAWDPPEWTPEDMARDHAAEIRRCLHRLEGMTEDEIMDQVHREFLFDLCPPCQRQYLRRPLGERPS